MFDQSMLINKREDSIENSATFKTMKEQWLERPCMVRDFTIGTCKASVRGSVVAVKWDRLRAG